ncbi:hypothetical protein [Mycolicibacterium sphagni]|uniref:Uncharacterized protein n=1 Tax=Mycolicibacterium sphagni TaxID=1786 RepID=A0ABX2K0V4_9MYCO|nr:hypothetical protein [Mycolicibacterium sphagni]NTY62602.1 hypothetical protein [Mycolicibacterium sphagni]
MSVLRVVHLPDFYFGGDAVVVVMDAAGLAVLIAALNQALAHGDCRIEHHPRTLEVQVQDGAADVGLDDAHVRWRIPHATVADMIAKLSAMNGVTSGHHYVDIATPARTLVLSVGEYLDAPWLNDPLGHP